MVNPFVLIPLYSYPSDSTWGGVYSQVEANPGVAFNIIINPSNGPGGSSPDSAFATGVSKLNSYNNTQLLGYVHVSSATRAAADVTADIDSYAAWSSYTSVDAHLDGIFFDEAPNDATSTAVSYMQDVTGHARSALALKGVTPYITLNPGTAVADSFYDTADSVVAFEDAFSAFSASNIALVSTTQRPKSAFIINSFTAASSDQSSVVSSLLTGDIPGAYITDSTSYNVVSTILGGLVSAVSGGGPIAGSSSSSSSSVSSTSATTAADTGNTATAEPTVTVDPTQTEPASTTVPGTSAYPTTLITSVVSSSVQTSNPTTASQTAEASSTTTATGTKSHYRHRHRPTSTSTAAESSSTASSDASDDTDCDSE